MRRDIVRSDIVCMLVFGLAGCAPDDVAVGEKAGTDQVLESVQQSLDSACVQSCMASCSCEPGVKPPQCRAACRIDCADACNASCVPSCSGALCGASDGCGGRCNSGICASGKTCGGGGVPNQCGCTPACANQACGAGDGCGGICNAGFCANGGICGGAGVPGQCALLPNLHAYVQGTYYTIGFNGKQADWVVTLHNGGPATAINAELQLQSNTVSSLLQLDKPNTFGCYIPPGFGTRLGLMCIGSLGAYDTVQIKLTTALSVSGYNVLSLFFDPDNKIQELDESDNSATNGVFVP